MQQTNFSRYIRIVVSLATLFVLISCSAATTGQIEQKPQPTPSEVVVTETKSPVEQPEWTNEQEEQTEQIEQEEQIELQEQEDLTAPDALPEIDKKRNLPDGFVYLDEIIPSAQYDIRYYSDNNFVGARIDGYLAPIAIVTVEMAEALQAVSEEMAAEGYQLIIHDAYRPRKAVDQFISWSQDSEDTAMKESFYPNVDKDKLFQLGYLSKRSGHSRGSTIDLTLAYLETGEEVDMGSPVDMLDEISHFATGQITKEQATNRKLLKTVMVKHGFKPYSKEWWHFTLGDEPYRDTYFDFDVE